jgi:hypothetical protein
MTFPLLISMRQLISAAAVCMATAALAQVEQPEPRADAALQDLTSEDMHVRNRALNGLLAQSGVQVHGPNAMRITVNSLLGTHPKQAERIKAALIAALEGQGADHVRLIQESQPINEEFGESWTSLTSAVAALQDPRAVKGLVLALPAGSTEGLADICYAAVDAIIERIHEPELYAGGAAVGYRRQAITALGWCLQRPTMIRANPDVLIKIRRELLADLNDPDWSIRIHAVDALSPLKTDPEVRVKLQTVIATDPYITSEYSPPNKPGSRYIIRDGASFILNSDAFSSYVTRTSGSRICRVQPASQAITGETFIGPETADFVRRVMCSHYDPTGQDPSLCWKVEPANACSQ